MKKGIEVDKAKVDTIRNMSTPKTVKDVDHFQAMQDSIKGFSKTLARQLNHYVSCQLNCTTSNGLPKSMNQL